jgi:putative transport protein
VRRGDALLDATPDMLLHHGDVVAVAGWSAALVADTNPLEDYELHDRDLLEIPMISADLVLTNRALAGQSLRLLAERIGARGIFLVALRRAGRDLPVTPATIIERGDVLNVSGARTEVMRVAAEIGYAEYPTAATDLFLVGAAIGLGGLIGVMGVPGGGATLKLSSPVGALLAGLTLGHLRSRHPRFGRIPEASAKLFESMGLTSFLALVAIQAGPEAIAAVRTSGVTLVVASASVTVLSHLAAVLVGRYVIGMHPGLLLGVCAGAGTSGPALAAIEREAESEVPTIGYGMGYAVGNVLTALGGTLLILAGS